MTVPATRHQVQWVASALRQAAAESGVELPLSYSLALAADGLASEPELALTRLGSGVVVHTKPRDEKRLPTVLGYADARGQWYRDGRRHVEAPDSQARDSQAPDSQARDSQARDSQARDSQARDSQARDSQARDSQALASNLGVAL